MQPALTCQASSQPRTCPMPCLPLLSLHHNHPHINSSMCLHVYVSVPGGDTWCSCRIYRVSQVTCYGTYTYHRVFLHATALSKPCCVCRGAQHEDCIRLLRRLQAAQQQASATACRGQIISPACKDAKLQQPFRIPPKWSPEVNSDATPFPDTTLALQSSAEQGRQLVMAHDVVAGSVLWTEEPFAHLLLKQHRKQVMASLLPVVHC